tara:strand:- start:20 stop:433 length:414 start_codon:yes stop_codon:yes gene_type:complete
MENKRVRLNNDNDIDGNNINYLNSIKVTKNNFADLINKKVRAYLNNKDDNDRVNKDENDRLNIIRTKQREELKKDEEIKIHTDHVTGQLFIYDYFNDIYYYKSQSGIGWGDNQEPYRTFLDKLKIKIKEQKNKKIKK